MTTAVVAHAAGHVRTALQKVLVDDDVDVLGTADSADAAVELCREATPDVVLAAVDLRDGPVYPHVPAILATGARILMLCEEPDVDDVRDLLLAGASGCVSLRDAPAVELVASVRAIAQGDSVLHPAAAAAVLHQWRTMQRRPREFSRAARTLTQRELEVLRSIADGLTTGATARQLGIATKTVESHKARIFDKLGTRNQAEAVAIAVRRGLLAHNGSDG